MSQWRKSRIEDARKMTDAWIPTTIGPGGIKTTVLQDRYFRAMQAGLLDRVPDVERWIDNALRRLKRRGILEYRDGRWHEVTP